MKRFFLGIIVLFLLGCVGTQTVVYASSGTYEEERNSSSNQDIINQITGGNDFSIDTGVSSVQPFLEKVVNTCYGFFSFIKEIAGIVIAASLLIGVLVCVFARKNKGMRRRCIVVFFFAIPVVFLVLVYGFGAVYGNIQLEKGVVVEVTDPVYQQVRQRYAQDLSSSMGVFELWYGELYELTPIIMLFLVLYGVVLRRLAKYDGKLRNIAIYGLCGFIPGALLLLTGGLPFISKIFK